MSKLIYLASPYSDPSYDVRMLRYRAVTFIASELMLGGELIYSPITHGHSIATERRRITSSGKIPTDWAYWKNHCIKILPVCEMVLVLALPGYRASEGVDQELQLASQLGIPHRFLSPWGYIDEKSYYIGVIKPLEGTEKWGTY